MSVKDYFDNLFQGILNPKGNLGDFAHAQSLSRHSNFRLAPRQKFLYHVVFELSSDALSVLSTFNSNTVLQKEINLLVKTADLPKMEMEVATKNMYNRKKNVQTSVGYAPVNITLHDDNLGITTALLEGYYRYYFADGNHQQGSNAFDPRSTYKDNTYHNIRYGFDNDSIGPFFDRITIFQLTRQTYTGFELINPLITNIQHDTMDYSDASGTVENQIQLVYEGIRYSRGGVEQGTPTGFGEEHYDTSPSPLTIAGGGTGNIFGPGGILEGIGGIFDGLQDGVDLGDIINIVNTAQNAKDLSSSRARAEIEGAAIGLAGAAVVGGISGIANTVFPKNSGSGGDASTQANNAASGGAVDTADPAYAEKVAQAQANNTGG